ncbi:DNA-processing protein DprA [Fodinicurvata sediminis]|uniref:DNA-processing protein DprA n=1 Tax=Fodinicurvata sediminis TaxID=1121832 RepID=UPI00047B3D15|nr:DNA-processing protein DprA [Fodinicurvata sediminis]
MTIESPAALSPAAPSPEDQRDWLRLARSERIGPATFRELLARFGTATKALEAVPELSRRGGRKSGIRLCSPESAEHELEQLERLGARLLRLCDPDYPDILKATDTAPPVLTSKGNIELLQAASIAIVGARNASLNARKLARRLAEELGAAGLVITSGLARGIDAAAHEGALDSGTIAVLAGGIDSVFPPENRQLQEQIAAQGLLLAESAPGTQPKAGHFPRRNRIVAGLSQGVLVVEAALRSGSLITARLALEEGREVFAIPGSPLDPRAKGTNDLIRQGAILTESAQDVLDGLGQGPGLSEPASDETFQSAPLSESEAELDEARQLLEELLSPVPIHQDELMRESGLPSGTVSLVLLELELAGRLERHPGRKIALIV